MILVHGGMLASQHFTKLADALSTDFTVHVPDRRGRGLSGPHGGDYRVEREVDDLRALVAATGASAAFGLSSGALVVLRTALVTPALDRVALYEPPLSIDGSVPVDWLHRFDREIAAGKLVSALVTAMKGLAAEPSLFSRIPRPALVPLLTIGVALRELANVLPHARSITLPGVGHTAPENDDAPLAVADALRDFFRAP